MARLYNVRLRSLLVNGIVLSRTNTEIKTGNELHTVLRLNYGYSNFVEHYSKEHVVRSMSTRFKVSSNIPILQTSIILTSFVLF